MFSKFRKSLARALRKWADLIDPSVSPAWQQNLIVNLSCDASGFNAALDDITKRMQEIQASAHRIGGIV